MTLQACTTRHPAPVLAKLQTHSSPLRWRDWQTALSMHPDRRFTDFIVPGVRDDFCIGVRYGQPLVKARLNKPSAGKHPEPVADYIAKELALGRLSGPLPLESFPGVHASKLGVVPKKGQNRWRLIFDLSAPEDRSINDGISPEW